MTTFFGFRLLVDWLVETDVSEERAVSIFRTVVNDARSVIALKLCAFVFIGALPKPLAPTLFIYRFI
jgi:hypothetical protein